MSSRTSPLAANSEHLFSASYKKRQGHSLLLVLAVITLTGLLAAPAEARPIRIEGQGMDWTDVVGPLTAPASTSLGFSFDFGGTVFGQVSMDASGNISFGSATQPFVVSPAIGFEYSQLINPILGGSVVDGFRMCWGCDGSEDPQTTTFQLAFFDLGSGKYVLEYNINTLLDTEIKANPFIGFDNGAGTSFDLIALSAATQIYGTGVPDFFGEGACDSATNSSSLACNSYFDPLLAGFGQAVSDYFTTDDNGEAAVGRYVFVVDNSTPPTTVPEPMPVVLLLLGLATLAWLRLNRPVAIRTD